jgi:hypothetical protein
VLLVEFFLFGRDGNLVGTYHAVVEDEDDEYNAHTEQDVERAGMEESLMLRIYFLLYFRLDVFYIWFVHGAKIRIFPYIPKRFLFFDDLSSVLDDDAPIAVADALTGEVVER